MVGIAGVIAPMPNIATEVLTRDWPVMMAMILALFFMAYGFRGQGRTTRLEGSLLLLGFVAYNTQLVMTAAST